MAEKKPAEKKAESSKQSPVKSLLRPATNDQAFLKTGILGFAGSGKTFTASNIAIGLYQHAKLKKPVAFLDTETGIDFMVPKFKEAKIELVTMRSRAFVDLMDVVREAEKNCSILIIDSISHIWAELLESFQKKLNVKRLLFQHWNQIKPEWRRFTDLYVSSHLHIIMCGRAGWEYDFTEDDDGVKELIKTGTKMKAETEMGYEPSLLLEMERVRTEEGKIGGTYVHRCWVLKDRADRINGKYFDDPGFEPFLPHVQFLNLGGKHQTTDSSRSSVELFEKRDSGSQLYKRAQIALEDIQNELVMRYPSTGGDDRVSKLKILKDVFGTHVWESIKILPVDKLEEGASKIKKLPNPKESAEQESKNAPANLCKEIVDFAAVNDISVPKFLRKWSEGKIDKLSDLRTSELKQVLSDMQKSKSRGGK